MFIDSFNIIALELHNCFSGIEMVNLPIENIFNIVDAIESDMPEIEVYCDMMSIDAFRCEFDDYVCVRDNSLVVHNVDKFQHMMTRYLPSEDVVLELKPFFEV